MTAVYYKLEDVALSICSSNAELEANHPDIILPADYETDYVVM